MNDFSRVKEDPAREYFRVIHHRLTVPADLFFAVAGDAGGDITEPDAQRFIYSYLSSQGRDGGLIGMVRITPEGEEIILDAAVRYPLEGSLEDGA